MWMDNILCEVSTMKKSVSISIAIIIFLLIFSSVYYVLSDSFKNRNLQAGDMATRNQQERQIFVEANDIYINKEEVFSVTIAAVGDILIHDSVFKDAYTGSGYDFKPMFENVKQYLQQADIAFANQETMLGGKELGLSGYPRFNSPTEVGDALKHIGIDIVSIANNHTLDVGEKGILNAIDYYNSEGILYTGAYESFEDREIIRTIEKDGIIFSFLAYTYGTNGIPVPNGKDYLVNLIDEERIVADIQKAKDISDVVVLSLHFGNEYEPFPNTRQKELAQMFSDAGANIIFGHHPHVLQPMDWITGEDGQKTFVAYSLGNFISGQKGIEREIGGILQLEVQKKVSRSATTIEINDPRFVPVFTYKNNWRQYKLYELEKIGNDVLYNAAQHYEKTKKHVATYLGDELQFSIPLEK